MTGPDQAPRPCPECGGARVNAAVSNYAFLRPAHSHLLANEKMRALVCTQCGHTTFYAERPTAFLPHTG